MVSVPFHNYGGKLIHSFFVNNSTSYPGAVSYAKCISDYVFSAFSKAVKNNAR